MYAVFRVGTHQYIAKPGDKLRIQRVEAPIGSQIKFKDLLLLSSNDQVHVQNVSGTVVGKVLEHDRAKKVDVYKKIRRHGYEKMQGHRQDYTLVEIQGIEV